MTKTLKISLLLCAASLTLLFLSGCGKIIDGNAGVGSVINFTDTAGASVETSVPEESEAAETGDAEPISAPEPTPEPESESETEPTPEPTPSPTPVPGDGGYDYGDSSGSGDSGSGISSFSSGGSSSSSLTDPLLPDPANTAVLETPGVGIDEQKNIVDILENVKLRPDGTLSAVNKNYANDKALANNLQMVQEQLRDDKNFDSFYFLTLIRKSDGAGDPVRIKLDKSYKNKTAYVFFVNGSGEIVNMASDKDYISYVLDERHFADNILEVDFGKEPGTFIIAFGAK